MNGVTSAWLAQIFIMSWRSWRRNKGLPYPYELVASFVIFGVLDVIHGAESARSITSVLAWGFVVASFMNMFPKSGTAQALNSTQPLLVKTPAPTTTTQAQPLYYIQPTGGFV